MFRDLIESMDGACNETSQHIVVMGSLDLGGSSLMGYFPTPVSYDTLVKVFGEPTFLSDGSKTRAEWNGKIDSLPFSIYDWKKAGSVETVTDWNIGGKSVDVVDMLTTYINDNK